MLDLPPTLSFHADSLGSLIFPAQPTFSQLPVPMHRLLRDLQDFGGFFNAQAAEKAQLDDLTLSRIQRRQRLEGRHQWRTGPGRPRPPPRIPPETPAQLQRRPPVSALDAIAPNQPEFAASGCGNGKEMSPAVPPVRRGFGCRTYASLTRAVAFEEYVCLFAM